MLQGLRANLPGKSSARVRAASESVIGRDVPVDAFDLEIGAYILSGGGGGSSTPKSLASPSRGGGRGGGAGGGRRESRGSIPPISPVAASNAPLTKGNDDVNDDMEDLSSETELTNALRLLDSTTWKDRVTAIETISKRASSLSSSLSATDAVRIADALASKLTDGHAKVGQAASNGIHLMLETIRGTLLEKVIFVLLPGLSAAMISSQKSISLTASACFDLIITNADAGMLLQPVVALVRGSSNQKLIAATLGKLAKLIPAAHLKKPLQLLRIAMPPVLEILEGGVSNQDVRAALSTVVKSLSSCFGETAILESASGSSVSEVTLERLKSMLRSAF